MTAEVHVGASVSGYWYCAGWLAITLSWLIATTLTQPSLVTPVLIIFMWPGLFQVTTVEERLRGSSTTCRRLGLLGPPPGSTHFAYIIICIRYCVNATCKLRCCCSVLYMQGKKNTWKPSFAKKSTFGGGLKLDSASHMEDKTENNCPWHAEINRLYFWPEGCCSANVSRCHIRNQHSYVYILFSLFDSILAIGTFIFYKALFTSMFACWQAGHTGCISNLCACVCVCVCGVTS